MWGIFIPQLSLVNMGTRVQAFDVHGETPTIHLHFQVLQLPEKTLEDAVKIASDHIKEVHKDGKMLSCSKTGSDQGLTEDQQKVFDDKGHFIYKIHPPEEPA